MPIELVTTDGVLALDGDESGRVLDRVSELGLS